MEFYKGNGSFGAGIGAGIFADAASASKERRPVAVVEPKQIALYEALYSEWKEILKSKLHKTEEVATLL